MAGIYNLSQKKAIYKWRDANRDKKRASDVRHLRWKKGKLEFLAILIDYEL